jgi:hypothetical protein
MAGRTRKPTARQRKSAAAHQVCEPRSAVVGRLGCSTTTPPSVALLAYSAVQIGLVLVAAPAVCPSCSPAARHR